MIKIYCFALYAQNGFVSKSEAFVTFRHNEEAARQAAQKANLKKWPENQGWFSHQESVIEIPHEKVLELAQQETNNVSK
jgi:hypothetical protein